MEKAHEILKSTFGFDSFKHEQEAVCTIALPRQPGTD